MVNNINVDYSEITPEIIALSKLCEQSCVINPDLYTKYEVKRGLRDVNGKGVLAGLTDISDVRATKMLDGQIVNAEGQLFYRGYNVESLVDDRDRRCWGLSVFRKAKIFRGLSCFFGRESA